MKVLAFGEILWDVIEGEEHLGGAPFNFAAHCAQCGNEAYIISKLGTDHLGIRAFDKCNTHAVRQDFIQWDENFPTGTVDVTLTNGQPDYVIHKNVAYDFIRADDFLKADQVQADIFYFGSLAQRNECSAATLKILISKLACRYVFYDVNLRKEGYTESIIRASLKVCNVFKLNIDELPEISKILTGEVLQLEDFARAVTSRFPNIKTIIITAADKGCYVCEPLKGVAYIPGVPVTVADAVGAGDAFSAAFMHTLAKHGNAAQAAKVANHIGAFVASQNGPIPKYSPQIETLLKSANP